MIFIDEEDKVTLTGGILDQVVSAPAGLAIAQSQCVIHLCVRMGSSWQAVGSVGELHKVTVILHVLIPNLPIQCGAAMVGPVQLDAPGHVMSTTSSMQQGQAAIRKRVLQMVRDLYQIQPF